jgi:hypothetical protein
LAWIFFFLFFLHNPYLFLELFEREIMTHIWRIYFGGWMACSCITLSIRVNILYLECTWILIMGAWKESQQGSQQFDKAQHEYKQHMSIRFLQSILSYGFGRIYHHWVTFFNFSILKMKTPDVKSFSEQSHSKFRLYHMITHNNLD